MVYTTHLAELGSESFEQFFEHAPFPVQCLAPDGTVLQANQALLDLLGYERRHYIGRQWGDFHADPDVVTDILADASHHEAVTDTPARLRCQDGSIRHVLITSHSYWKDDQLVHTHCFIRDTTDPKETQRHSSDILATLRALAETSQALIGLVDGERILYLNPAFRRALDVSEAFVSAFRLGTMMEQDVSGKTTAEPEGRCVRNLLARGGERCEHISKSARLDRRPRVVGELGRVRGILLREPPEADTRGSQAQRSEAQQSSPDLSAFLSGHATRRVSRRTHARIVASDVREFYGRVSLYTGSGTRLPSRRMVASRARRRPGQGPATIRPTRPAEIQQMARRHRTAGRNRPNV